MNPRFGDSILTGWPPPRSMRRSAIASPSGPIQPASPSWTISVGVTPSGRRAGQPRAGGPWLPRRGRRLVTPFISGKDSLNNEFSYIDATGQRQTVSIPPSLLISALGQIENIGDAVTMDAEEPGNLVYLIGQTTAELGGSHFSLVEGLEGGDAPRVDLAGAPRIFRAVHSAIQQHLRAKLPRFERRRPGRRRGRDGVRRRFGDRARSVGFAEGERSRRRGHASLFREQHAVPGRGAAKAPRPFRTLSLPISPWSSSGESANRVAYS